MKAEEHKQAPPPAKGADHPGEHHRPQPTVGETLAEVLAVIRSMVTVNPRLLGLILSLAVIGGAWWYFSREGRRIDSSRWTELEQLSRFAAFEDFANNNPNTVPGKVARLEEARRLYGPGGVARLSDRETRTAALSNIEKARDEFLVLAEEFSRDPAMRAECLRGAGEAELALVGVPKIGSASAFRGNLEEAIRLLRAAADAVGADTDAGRQFAARADDLQKNAAEVRRVGEILASQMTPPELPDIKLPPSLTKPEEQAEANEAPKPPEGPISPPPADVAPQIPADPPSEQAPEPKP